MRQFITVCVSILIYTNVFALTKPVDVRDYNMNYTGVLNTGEFDYIGDSGQNSTLYRDNQDGGSYCGCGEGEGSGSHPGVDIPCPVGTQVRSIANGTVILSECDNGCCNGPGCGWGEYIVIRHDLPSVGTIFSLYAHLSVRNVFVGNSVIEGTTIIGLSGSTGYSTGPHLHFQIERQSRLDNGQSVNHPYWFQDVDHVDALHVIEANTINPMPFLQMGNYRPCYMPVGFVLNADYSGNPTWLTNGLSEAFRDRYDDFYDDEETALGFPWHNPENPDWMTHGSAVHRVANMWIQDFYGPHNGIQGNPHTSLIKHDQHDVHLLKGGFWDYWMHNCGWTTLGAPIDEEHIVPACGNATRQSFLGNDGITRVLAWEAPWPDIENTNCASITRNQCTFTTVSRDADGIYHSGAFVTAYNDPIELLNGSTYNGFYGIIGGEQVNIAPFTVNGDMTIEVNGCGLPYVTGVSASEDECVGVYVTWQDLNGQHQYQVVRNGIPIADSLHESVNSYWDHTAEPEVIYNYAVKIRLGQCLGEQSLADQGWRGQAPPAAPSNCVASESECDNVIVTWIDNSYNEDGFYVNKDGYIFGVPANNTSFVDTNPTGNHNYFVKSYNDCGESDSSNVDMGTYAVPPFQVEYLNASEDQCEGVFLTWGNVFLETSYRVYRDGTFLGTTPQDVTSYMDYTAAPDVPYNYAVQSVRFNCPAMMSPSDIGIKQGAPPQVQGVSATENLCDRIDITWQDVSDSIEYIVFRDGSQIGNNLPPYPTAYSDVSAIAGVTYNYTVSALNGNCAGTPSQSDIGERINCNSPPLEVTDLTIKYHDDDQVELNWSPVTEDSEGNPLTIVYYAVYSSSDIDFIPSPLTLHSLVPDNLLITYIYETQQFYKIITITGNEFILQPGHGAGKDIWTTSVYSYAPGGGGPGGGLDNYELRVGGWGDYYHSLLQFDLSALPQSASQAILFLYSFSVPNQGSPVSMYFDRIIEEWDWDRNDRLWWADRPAATQWLPQPLPAPARNVWYSIDITDLYNSWQSGIHVNYGMQLRPTNVSNRSNTFYSSDYLADPSLRPYIRVVP